MCSLFYPNDYIVIYSVEERLYRQLLSNQYLYSGMSMLRFFFKATQAMYRLQVSLIWIYTQHAEYIRLKVLFHIQLINQRSMRMNVRCAPFSISEFCKKFEFFDKPMTILVLLVDKNYTYASICLCQYEDKNHYVNYLKISSCNLLIYPAVQYSLSIYLLAFMLSMPYEVIYKFLV